MEGKAAVNTNQRLEHLTVTPDLIRRFMEQVSPEPNTGCWLWMGSLTGYVHPIYGALCVDGTTFAAHRLSHRIFKGHPGVLDVCHECDNPWCVNPQHLWLGTRQQNMADRQRKGRHWRARAPHKSNPWRSREWPE